MRNRRLLTLAVLAVAIGFVAYAQAAENGVPYGTAVLTLIQDPNVGGVIQTGTYDINIRLWDDSGIGKDANTPGLVDFVIKSIRGTGGLGDVVVTGASISAPFGMVQDANYTYGAGFTGIDKLGISYAGLNRVEVSEKVFVDIPNNYNAVGFQPVAYDPNFAQGGVNKPLRDAGILIGVGTTGRAGSDLPQNNSTYPAAQWKDGNNPFPYAGDTPIIHGTYNSGTGGIVVETYGVLSFDVLPGTPSTVFVGPAVDANTFGVPVKAVVVQTTSGFGNDGGKQISNAPISWQLVEGNVVLGPEFKAGQQKGVGGALSTIANMTLNIADANTSVKFGAYHVLAGLNINTAPAGTQKVDVAQYGAAIYSDSSPAQLNAAEAALVTAIQIGVSSGGTEGLVSSDPNVGPTIGSGSKSIGFARKTDAASLDYLDVRLALTGDVNLDGYVDTQDRAAIIGNWDPTGSTGGMKWYNGDINMDGYVDTQDRATIIGNWNPTGVGSPFVLPPSPAPAVPEPATMGLLALGALGLIRRRRA
jgi:hypothetical protein